MLSSSLLIMTLSWFSYSQYICTLTRARRIIVCCWIFALFYSSPWLLLSTVKYSCIQGFGMVRYSHNFKSEGTLIRFYPHKCVDVFKTLINSFGYILDYCVSAICTYILVLRILFCKVPKCDFRLRRDSTMYIVIFLTDITLFYLIPLVLSVVLYTLIAVMLLFTAPRTFNDGTVRNQARLQVSDKK